jgi:hypothetical protein
MALSEQASFAALLAISSEEKGKPRFAGLRPVMLCTDFDATHRVDIMRAALGLSDKELADLQAEHLMAGPDAKKVFGTLRAQYALHGREKTCGKSSGRWRSSASSTKTNRPTTPLQMPRPAQPLPSQTRPRHWRSASRMLGR